MKNSSQHLINGIPIKTRVTADNGFYHIELKQDGQQWRRLHSTLSLAKARAILVEVRANRYNRTAIKKLVFSPLAYREKQRTKEQLIKQWFEDNPDKPLTTELLADHLTISERSASELLYNMMRNGELDRTLEGKYSHYFPPGSLRRVENFEEEVLELLRRVRKGLSAQAIFKQLGAHTPHTMRYPLSAMVKKGLLITYIVGKQSRVYRYNDQIRDDAEGWKCDTVPYGDNN